MDTSLNIPPAAAPTHAAPVLPKTMTTKVQAVEPGEDTATLPSNKPFVAQIVSAQLSGVDQAESKPEAAQTARTLRPYDVPMLPYEGEVNEIVNQQPANNITRSPESSSNQL